MCDYKGFVILIYSISHNFQNLKVTVCNFYKCIQRGKFIVLLSFLFCLSSTTTLQSQTDIREYTLQIIDTADSQFEQAKTIFNWVAGQIRYDVKALYESENPDDSPQQTIKSRKGLCDDYSNLYSAMCNSVGIETYVISGYTKGFDYNKQKPFIKSNHAWNVSFTDSAWIHTDATWGSGGLAKRPPAFRKVLYNMVRLPYANNKVYFVPDVDFSYFNIPLDSLVKTHYPIDPKWLFNPAPIAFNQFVEDSLRIPLAYPDYNLEIEKIRRKTEFQLMMEDGTKATEINPLNHFNKAYAYYLNSLNYDIEREITASNKWQFENYYRDYGIMKQATEKHRTISDSVYRARSTELKTLERDQKRLTNRIKSKTSKAKKSQRSGEKAIVGKASSYTKKMNAYQINIGRAEIRKLKPFDSTKTSNVPVSADTLVIFSAHKEINLLQADQNHLRLKMDSLFSILDNYAQLDARIDDSIAKSNKEFKFNVVKLTYMVLSGDEPLIFDYVDSLKTIYAHIENFIGDKKAAKSDLQNTARDYYAHTGLMEKSLKDQATLYSKINKLTPKDELIIQTHNACIDTLIKVYKQSMVFTRKLANHNELQSEIRQQNLKALKEQKKSIQSENKFFAAWYENHIDHEKELQENEKILVKTMLSHAVKNQKTVELKLKNLSE